MHPQTRVSPRFDSLSWSYQSWKMEEPPWHGTSCLHGTFRCRWEKKALILGNRFFSSAPAVATKVLDLSEIHLNVRWAVGSNWSSRDHSSLPHYHCTQWSGDSAWLEKMSCLAFRNRLISCSDMPSLCQRKFWVFVFVLWVFWESQRENINRQRGGKKHT